MQKASIYNPVDNSLEMRVDALLKTSQSVYGVEACLSQTKTKGYNSVLGTEKELKTAHEISNSSYQKAIKSLSRSELEKARDKKLLSAKEYQKITLQKDKMRIQKARNDNKPYGKGSTFQK